MRASLCGEKLTLGLCKIDFKPKVSTSWIPKSMFSFKENSIPAHVMDSRHLRVMLMSQQKGLVAVGRDSCTQELVFRVVVNCFQRRPCSHYSERQKGEFIRVTQSALFEDIGVSY